MALSEYWASFFVDWIPLQYQQKLWHFFNFHFIKFCIVNALLWKLIRLTPMLPQFISNWQHKSVDFFVYDWGSGDNPLVMWWFCGGFCDVFRGYINITVGKIVLIELMTYKINTVFFMKVVTLKYLMHVGIKLTKSLLYKLAFFVLFISITFYLIEIVK